MDMINETAAMYIDPATTSLIIQIGAGVVITAGTFLGIFWSKIKRKFKKGDPEDAAINATDMKSLGENEKDVITADDLLSDDDDEN